MAVYIISNKTKSKSALKQTSRFIRNITKKKNPNLEVTACDFILGGSSNNSEQDKLSELFRQADGGDVFITDGNQENSGEIYPPLLMAIEIAAKKNRNAPITVILHSANANRVEQFKKATAHLKSNPNINIICVTYPNVVKTYRDLHPITNIHDQLNNIKKTEEEIKQTRSPSPTKLEKQLTNSAIAKAKEAENLVREASPAPAASLSEHKTLAQQEIEAQAIRDSQEIINEANLIKNINQAIIRSNTIGEQQQNTDSVITGHKRTRNPSGSPDSNNQEDTAFQEEYSNTNITDFMRSLRSDTGEPAKKSPRFFEEDIDSKRDKNRKIGAMAPTPKHIMKK